MTADQHEHDPDFSTIRFAREDLVLRVTIDRPGDDLNRVDGALHDDLTRLFPRLQQERQARAILLTGAGRAFSAGGDFEWFPSLQEPATGSKRCGSMPSR